MSRRNGTGCLAFASVAFSYLKFKTNVKYLSYFSILQRFLILCTSAVCTLMTPKIYFLLGKTNLLYINNVNTYLQNYANAKFLT